LFCPLYRLVFEAKFVAIHICAADIVIHTL